MRLNWLWATCLILAVAAPAVAAPDDGFAPFYATFAEAIAKDDKVALASMVVLSPDLDADITPLTFAKFHAAHLGPAERRCLARGKPLRDVDGNGVVNYAVFCGEIIFGFHKVAGGWKLTDLGVND